MRAILGFVGVVVLLPGEAARASEPTPVSPPSGSSFTTTDSVTFVADSGSDSRDYTILFSKGLQLDPVLWLDLGETSGAVEVDLGWLATKFDHLGNFAWATCPLGAEVEGGREVLVGECSPAWTFLVSFRLPTLTRGQARSAASYVIGHQFRRWLGSGFERSVSCSRVTRIRQRCRVSGFAGDTVLSGRITVWMKRDGSRPWAFEHYRARLTLTNEYCHLVNDRPLEECRATRRRTGMVYG